MALPVSISNLSTNLVPIGPFRQVTNTVPVDGNGFSLGHTNTFRRVGQTFSTSGGTLTTAYFNIRKVGSPTDNLVCDVYAVNGSNLPTGASLGQSAAVAGSGLATSYADSYSTFTFSGVSLTASTTYALVLSRSGSLSDTNRYEVGQTGNFYSSGNQISDNGTWATQSSDFFFKTNLTTFNASTPRYYAFGRDASTATTLRAIGAHDPSVTWLSGDQSTGLTTAVQTLAAVQDGDTIHIALIDGATTSCNLKYRTFNMATGSFVTSETVHSAFDPTSSSGTNMYGCSICMQNSQPTILYNGARQASMGNSYSQTFERHRTGTNTWSAGQQVSAGGQINFGTPDAVTGTSNRAHFFFNDASTPAVVTRSLNSSYVLQTADSETVGLTQLLNGAFYPASGVSYDESGTQRVLFSTEVQNALQNAAVSFNFNSADAPTLTEVTIQSDAFVPRFFSHAGIGYVIYADGGDSDLYVEQTANGGSSWTTRVNIWTANFVTGHLGHDAKIYQRDNSLVIPFIIDDGGTLKYNEYAIVTALADAWSVIDKDSVIALSNSDKTATGSGSGGVRGTTGRSSSSSTKYYTEFYINNWISGGSPSVGLKLSSITVSSLVNAVYSVASTGNVWLDSSIIGNFCTSYGDADVICVAWDASAGKIWYRKNAESWNNDGSANPATGTNGFDVSSLAAGTYHPWLLCSPASGESATVRTEAAEYTQTPPVGFKSWMDETLTQPKAPTPYKQAPRFIRRMR